MRVGVPDGKTVVKVIANEDGQVVQTDDLGYVDGYVRGPYAIFIRLEDGLMDLVRPVHLQAVDNYYEI